MCGNMVSSLKMTPWLIAVFCLVTADCSNVTDQETSESQRNQVAILKQIRKLNDDGSYSYGYEAGDGSFKVENRDVLGNIKGTFGFVDADGETKRISYSSLNGTGFKITTVSPLQEQLSVVQTIPRVNRTTTTKKPSVSYVTSTESSTSKSSVVQAIPRSRKSSMTTSTTTIPTSTDTPRPHYGHYLKPTPKTRPRFVISGSPKQSSNEDEANDDSQITRPNVDEKIPNYRRILFAKRPIDHNLRPITEEFEEKEEETKITSGNNLRRQLHDETTKSEPIQENINDDRTQVYGIGTSSTTRPLFTTSTTSTRLLHRISGSRTDRPRTIFHNRNNFGPAKFDDDNKYESTRVYEDETKSMEDDREPIRPITVRLPSRIVNDDREYVRREPTDENIYVQRENREPYYRDLLSSGLLVPDVNNREDSDYRTGIPPTRIFYRPRENRQPIYSTKPDENIRYNTETPIPETNDDSRLPISQNYPIPRAFQRPLIYPSREILRQRGFQRSMMNQQIPRPIDDSEYNVRSVADDYGLGSNPMDLNVEPPKPISLPLSRRDFQVLLKRLLVSRYGVEALVHPRSYLEDALYDQQSHPTYQPVAYQSPLTRQSIPYESPTNSRRYGDRVQIPRQAHGGGSNDRYRPRPYDDYDEGRYAKRIYRQKFYTPGMGGEEGDEILPPAVREALLLRMLQLAINSQRPTMATLMTSTAVPTSIYRKNGPVRSVQIISDDDDDNESMRNKT